MCKWAGVSPGRRQATRLVSSLGSVWLRTESGAQPECRLERWLSSSFLQGTRPRFASGTLMSLRTIPPFRAGIAGGRVFWMAALGPATGACRCTFRKRHQGTLSGALRSEARRERSAREGGFPCRSVGRCAPAASLGRGRGTRTSTAPRAIPVLPPNRGVKPGAQPLTTRPGFPYTVNRVYQRTVFCTRFAGITFRKTSYIFRTPVEASSPRRRYTL